MVSQAITVTDLTDDGKPPPEWFEHAIAKLQIQLLHENWDAAHRVIDQAKAQVAALVRRRNPDAVKCLPLEAKLQLPVPSLEGISLRTGNALEGQGILTVRALVHVSASDIQEIPNMGYKAAMEIRAALVALGLHMAGETLAMAEALVAEFRRKEAKAKKKNCTEGTES